MTIITLTYLSHLLQDALFRSRWHDANAYSDQFPESNDCSTDSEEEYITVSRAQQYRASRGDLRGFWDLEDPLARAILQKAIYVLGLLS